ncbi:MAG TPA: DNA-3-methyladenine glycosylase I [Candidatus Dormibacteraeota bacterium]|nr:DNA-3-methyladenine glycosylase I [Candidatus Dormibacteraeota bacterium]
MGSTSGISVGLDGVARCSWADSSDLDRSYHDTEWGRPVADDRRLFEKLCLEGFMSGLSWLTILRKRENFRAAFHDFDPATVARFGSRDVARLMDDASIVRNRAKIEATINNARRHADLVSEFGSLPAYVWRFEPKRRPEGVLPEAVAMSKDLRKRGWAFVGPTTVLSFMQAMGLVNDHVRGCAAGAEVTRLRREFVRPL